MRVKSGNRRRHIVAALAAGLALLLALAGCAKEQEPAVSLPPIARAELLPEPVASDESTQTVPQLPLCDAVREVDFVELQKKNLDIVAWLYMPGSVIDYPVPQARDNAFYLTRDEFGVDKVGGSLFLDVFNQVNFTDPVTLIYGHYMPNGTLFTDLHNYEDEEYFAANTAVYVIQPYKQLEYEVVAAYETGNQSLTYQTDYTDPAVMQAFIEGIREKVDEEAAIVNIDALDEDARYLVLSTCPVRGDPSVRYLVVAKLVFEGRLEGQPADG